MVADFRDRDEVGLAGRSMQVQHGSTDRYGQVLPRDEHSLSILPTVFWSVWNVWSQVDRDLVAVPATYPTRMLVFVKIYSFPSLGFQPLPNRRPGRVGFINLEAKRPADWNGFI
jgi:hypothetical protein